MALLEVGLGLTDTFRGHHGIRTAISVGHGYGPTEDTVLVVGAIAVREAVGDLIHAESLADGRYRKGITATGASRKDREADLRCVTVLVSSTLFISRAQFLDRLAASRRHITKLSGCTVAMVRAVADSWNTAFVLAADLIRAAIAIRNALGFAFVTDARGLPIDEAA